MTKQQFTEVLGKYGYKQSTAELLYALMSEDTLRLFSVAEARGEDTVEVLDRFLEKNELFNPDLNAEQMNNAADILLEMMGEESATEQLN